MKTLTLLEEARDDVRSLYADVDDATDVVKLFLELVSHEDILGLGRAWGEATVHEDESDATGGCVALRS
jgi:hypothetical protein